MALSKPVDREMRMAVEKVDARMTLVNLIIVKRKYTSKSNYLQRHLM